jgi:hypothetical protein
MFFFQFNYVLSECWIEVLITSTKQIRIKRFKIFFCVFKELFNYYVPFLIQLLFLYNILFWSVVQCETVHRVSVTMFWVWSNVKRCICQNLSTIWHLEFLINYCILENLKVWVLSMYFIDCMSDCISSTETPLTILVWVSLTSGLKHLEVSYLVFEQREISYLVLEQL